MKSPISDKIKGGDIKIKKKKRSPLSDKYRQFLNHENIELKPSKIPKLIPSNTAYCIADLSVVVFK